MVRNTWASIAVLMMIGMMLWARPPVVAAQAERHSRRDPVFDMSSDLVVVDISVTGPRGRPVTGLKKENFRLSEDGVQQEIAFFDTSHQPVSIGLVLDRSGSMMGIIHEVYAAALATLEAGIVEDEAFIITFNNKVKRVSRFTTNSDLLKRAVEHLKADGTTALYDGIRRGLDYIRKGRHRKKALVVVTDGMDNGSVTTYRQVLALALERGVPIYVVGLSAAAAQLGRLSRTTGGRNYYTFNMTNIGDTCTRISVELHRQYSLAYYPRKPLGQGEWRNIKVEVIQPEGHPAMRVRTRRGYYARIRH